MIIQGEDGITHINIYSKGKTELGRWLSNFTYCPMETENGAFNSIEGYWYWLNTLHDPLRSLHGFKAKKIGKEQEKLRELPEELFREKIKNALDVKLRLNYKWLGNSELPFCHYYDYKGNKVDAGYEWIVEHIERRRRDIKEWNIKKYK